MTKHDFLNQLKTSLAGEVPDSEVDSNIKFYDDYINMKSTENTEDNVMEKLGDPRLIAKTIIETYQMSHPPFYNAAKHNKVYEDVNTSDESSYGHAQSGQNGGNDNFGYSSFKIHTSLNWFQKICLTLVLIAAVILLIVIGGILMRLFFSIGIPILVVYLVVRLIRNNTGR